MIEHGAGIPGDFLDFLPRVIPKYYTAARFRKTLRQPHVAVAAIPEAALSPSQQSCSDPESNICRNPKRLSVCTGDPEKRLSGDPALGRPLVTMMVLAIPVVFLPN